MVNSRRYLAPLLLVGALFPGIELPGAEFVRLKFVVFATDLPKEVMYLPKANDEPVTLKFFSTERSKVYEYEGSNPIVFFTEVDVPYDPARPLAPRVQRVPVGYVSVPGGIDEALIFFATEGTWSPNTIPRFNVSIFNDSLASFPKDHAVFLNATGSDLYGTVGGMEISVPSGWSAPVRIGQGETKVYLNKLDRTGSIPVFSSMVPLGRNQRVTVVLLPPDRPDIHFLQRRLLYDPNVRPKVARPKELEES